MPESWSEYRRRHINNVLRVAQAAAGELAPLVYEYGKKRVADAVAEQLTAKRAKRAAVPVGLKEVELSPSVLKSVKVEKSSMPGYFAKRFTKPKAKPYTKYPVVIKTEHAGQVTGAGGDALYVGHGVAYRRAMVTLCYTVVHRLYTKHGISMVDWRDQCNAQMRLIIYFKTEPLSAVDSQFTTPMSGTASPLNLLAEEFYDFVQKFYAGSGTGSYGYVYGEWKLIQLQVLDDNGGAGVWNTVSSVDLTHCSLELSFYSHMKVQNTTVGDLATDDQADDVTNNPLGGRIYGGNGNGPYYKRIGGAPTNALAVAHGDTGVIELDRTGMTGAAVENLRRPFDRNMMGNVQSVGSVVLQPGQIRPDVVKGVKKMMFNSWMRLFSTIYYLTPPGGQVQQARVNLFQYHLLGLEKMVRTGATNALVGYEVDQIYRCKMIQQKAQLSALQFIS